MLSQQLKITSKLDMKYISCELYSAACNRKLK